ncbi:MAG: DUF2336 domain-containing protein [Alphaproteobacteria bacterium]|nr:DUF2336 domain-containing protein [Alphaproteobacteria bacterium]
MSDNAPQFQRLIELAKEPSSDKRRELLRQVTDVFLDNAPSYSATERDHFGVILGHVAADMDIAVRKQLSKQFANVPSAPHSLILQLANDEFGVAKEVLLKSTVLTDDDLIAIARNHTQEKLEAIAGRHTVSEAVSHALVENGDDQIVVKLISNTGAKVSRETMTRVVERSENNEALQAPLIARTDMPPDMLQDMFTFVSGELRAKITKTLESLPPEVIDAAFKEAEKGFAEDMRQARASERRAMAYVNELIRLKKLTEPQLHELLRNNKNVEFVHAFARLVDVDLKTVRRIFNTCNVEGVAVMCKSARFDRATFTAVIFFLDPTPKRSLQVANELAPLYDRVSPESAQRVLRFWRVRKDATQAQTVPTAAVA